MYKRIKVQGKLSMTFAILLSATLLLIGIYFLYIGATADYLSSHTRTEISGLLVTILIFIPLWINNAKSEGEYASELILDEKYLKIVYKNNKLERTEKVLLEDIRNISATLNANNVRTGKSASLFCETIVNINKKNGETISFTENPTASFSFCNYAFMLRLLDIAQYLPNFEYKVNGNSDVTKQDVEHYAKYGMRLPLLRRQYIMFQQYPIWSRFLLLCCFVPFIICIALLIYMNFPSFLNNTDKEYVALIEKGYEYYQNDLYDESLSEYSKALNIHDDDSTLYYYRALSFYYNKQYQKAAEEAQKGINVLNRKSLYHNAKKWRFANNDIGLYSILGDCERKLKNYKDAISAYDYVINKIKYTYTNVYFKRGRCKYYLDEKSSALSDFIKHKQIIENYLRNQEESEYKDNYPTYTNEDLDNIDKWIRACQ